MKITEARIKQIIKEELESVMREMQDGAESKTPRDEAEHVWLAWLAQNYPDYKEYAPTDEMVEEFEQEHPEYAGAYIGGDGDVVYYKEDPFV